jgi:hypothetical protein
MRVSWLVAVVACSSPPPAPSSPPPAAPAPPPVAPAADAFPAQPADAPIGTAHPVLVEELADNGSWLVICQARADTNHDGRIEVGVGFHGDMFGDKMLPYLVFGGGPGIAIDSYVASTDDDAWLAIVRDGKLELVETKTRKHTVVAGADVRDDGVPFGGSRVAAIGGGRMLYFRSDRIVIRELASGQEREVAVTGTPWRAEIDSKGAWARIAVMPAGHAFPVAQTTLAARGCRGEPRAYSSGGIDGEWTVRWLDVEHATLVDKEPPEKETSFRGRGRSRMAGQYGTKMFCSPGEGCRDSDDKPIKLPGRVEYAWGDRALVKDGKRWLVYDGVKRAAEPLPATGEFEGGDADVVAIEGKLYLLATRAVLGSSKTETVVAHAGDHILLGRTGPPCTPKPGDMPYACVDGVANPAAGGHSALPTGPLRWAR